MNIELNFSQFFCTKKNSSPTRSLLLSSWKHFIISNNLKQISSKERRNIDLEKFPLLIIILERRGKNLEEKSTQAEREGKRIVVLGTGCCSEIQNLAA